MKPTLNKKAICNFLTIRYDPSEKAILNKATWQSFREKTSDPNGIKTKSLLVNSIKKLASNFDTITISLSSGIDSSLCLALLRETFPKKKIVSICGVFAEGFDESKIARRIANKFDAQFKIVHLKSAFSYMPELIAVSLKPKWNTYQHLIVKEAKNHANILFTGDGADEIFGGYTFRYSKFLNLLKPSDNWKTKTINYLECHNRDWVPDQEHLFGSAVKFNWNDIYKYFKPYFSNPLSPLQQIMLADFNGKLLYDFIPTARSINNFYHLVGVSIFLDRQIIDFALSLPVVQKYDQKNQKGKLVLRKLAKKMNIEHIEEKRGFSPSLWYDWKNHGKKICKKYLLSTDSNIIRKKIINPNWLVRAFERIDNDGDQRSLNRVISILALEIWYRMFVTKDLTQKRKLS